MNAQILKKQEKNISTVLLIVACVMAFLSAGKVIGMVTASSSAAKQLETAVAEYNAVDAAEDKYLEESRNDAAELKKKNLFVPPPPKMNPVQAVTGILGDTALIGDKWYKAGDKVGDAQIVEIQPTKVKVAWDGKDTWFAPISAGPVASMPGGPMPGPDRGDRGERGRMGFGEGSRGSRGGFMGLSEEDMGRMKEARTRWENASEAEREQMMQEFRGRFGGGRFGGGDDSGRRDGGGRRGRGD